MQSSSPLAEAVGLISLVVADVAQVVGGRVAVVLAGSTVTGAARDRLEAVALEADQASLFV
jgi:hypothetical protein